MRNKVFDCHLSPDWRQMTIENTLSREFGSHLTVKRQLVACLILMKLVYNFVVCVLLC